MELRILRYFLVVARVQNITRAAEILHITQPTLSRQLMQLEQELGKKLLERNKGHLELTPYGMRLRRRAEELVTLADKTEQEFKGEETDIVGELWIGSGESEQFHSLSRAMKEFSLHHPLVKFNLFSGNADDIKEKMANGLIDIALLMEPVEIDSYDFIRLPDKDRWGILLPIQDPLATHPSITPEDLIGASLITSQRSLVHHEIENWFHGLYDTTREIASVNLIHNAALMVEDGLGYAITLEHLIDHHAGTSVCFRPFEPPMETGCVLVWKKHQLFSPVAAAFIKYLEATYRGKTRTEKVQ